MAEREVFVMARLGDYVIIKTGKLDANASSENGQYPFFTCSVEPLKIDTDSYDGVIACSHRGVDLTCSG